MKKLVSVFLILVIILTGVVYAIESAPDELSTSIEAPSVGVDAAPGEVQDGVEDPSEAIDLTSGEVNDSVSNTNHGEESSNDLDTNALVDELTQPIVTTGQGVAESYSSIPKVNVSFTSPIFKIIVLAVAVIIIILLLLSLSRKKDTTYSDHDDIAPRKRAPKSSKKEVLPDLEPSEPSFSPKEEIIIPPLKMEDKNKDLDFNKIEDDLILDLEKVETSDIKLADDFPKDIELVLDNSLDDIDDIDQLSKAIEEKEAELKKLEEEILEEKVNNEKVEDKVEEVEAEVKDILQEAIDLSLVAEVEKAEKTQKEKENKTDKKIKEKDTKTKVTPKTKSKEIEVVELETENVSEEDEETSALVEDFLKNMEKSMKEDNKK